MKKSVIVLFISVLFTSVTLWSQENYYTVIAMKGKVTLQKNAVGDWKLINTGDKLFEGDKLKLVAGNYIGLAHSTGKTVEIKTEGVYEVNEISRKLANTKNSLASNFTKYVANEIASANIKSKNMKMLGAVVRAGMNCIDLNSPCNSYLSEPLLNAAWFPANSKSYIFHLLNPSGKTLYMQVLSDSSLTVDLKDFNVREEACYKWFVTSAENGTIISDTSNFFLAGTSRLKAMNDSLKALMASFDAPDLLINQLIIASFYKQNKFYQDANAVFENIMKNAPDIEAFKDIYIDFLTTAGMHRMAGLFFNQEQ